MQILVLPGDGSMVTIAGEVIHTSKINDGAQINIDNGGNWSAPIDLPITSATNVAIFSGGLRQLKVVDSSGRVSTVDLFFLGRQSLLI